MIGFRHGYCSVNELAENGRIPRIPIFIDSLAIKLTEIYKNIINILMKPPANLFNPATPFSIFRNEDDFDGGRI